MKKMLKKMGLAVLTMALIGNVMFVAAAEEVAPAPAPVAVEAPAPAVEEKPAPAEKPAEPAPAVEAAPAPEATAAPVEVTVAPAPEVTEAPAAEATAAPAEATAAPAPEATEAPAVEATEAPAAEATEAPAEATVAPTAEATPAPEATVEPFTGSVKVKLENDGEIFFGDKITLRAEVSDANADYAIRWEVSKSGDNNWEIISGETSKTYDFVVTEENVEYAYRAVLVVAD